MKSHNCGKLREMENGQRHTAHWAPYIASTAIVFTHTHTFTHTHISYFFLWPGHNVNKKRQEMFAICMKILRKEKCKKRKEISVKISKSSPPSPSFPRTPYEK